MKLDGKIAIVTGAAKGLGEAIARAFVAEGATVILSDVDEQAGHHAAAAIGGKAHFRRLDVTNEADWQDLVAETVQTFGRLDILINNAGICELGTIETATSEQWRRIFAVVSDGTFFGCKHAVRAMKKTGGGSIVNVSSVASLQGEPYNVAYVAAKGAVEAMTRSIAVYCVKSRLGIRCNSFHPGPIDTPMVAGLAEAFAAAEEGTIPPRAGQPGERSYFATPDEMAPAIVYLASGEAKYVNGTRLVADNTMSIISGFVPE